MIRALIEGPDHLFWQLSHQWMNLAQKQNLICNAGKKCIFSFLAIDWKKQYPFADFLRESYIYPGRSIPAHYIIDAIEKGMKGMKSNKDEKTFFSLNCKIMKGYNAPVLTEVAVCFNAKNMEPKSCGKLFGGMGGSCPKRGMIWFINPKQQPYLLMNFRAGLQPASYSNQGKVVQ